MYSLAREILFRLNPESSHDLALDWLGVGERLKLLPLFAKNIPQDPVSVMGIQFPNRVGLAAGLDKNGDYFNALGQLGFGFVEIGTITPKPQPGNPKPRMFRLQEHKAIINRMGFNNKGVAHLVERVKQKRYQGVLGINIGKNKDTAEENALSDYLICLEAVYAYADYVTVNISSPNTPGLRKLQFGESLAKLIHGVKEKRAELSQTHEKTVPIAVKIAPDMTDDEIKSVADTLAQAEVDAIIATNTTVDRQAVDGHAHAQEAGGLSGKPVREKSTHVIATIHNHLNGALPIIGVGGILSGEDAQEKIQAGASLVQLYSGFIYQGPQLIADASNSLAAMATGLENSEST